MWFAAGAGVSQRKADNFRNDHGAVMTVDEIGRVLGTTRGAWTLKSAMRKPRKRKVPVQRIRDLVDMRARRSA